MQNNCCLTLIIEAVVITSKKPLKYRHLVLLDRYFEMKSQQKMIVTYMERESLIPVHTIAVFVTLFVEQDPSLRNIHRSRIRMVLVTWNSRLTLSSKRPTFAENLDATRERMNAKTSRQQ